MSCTYDAKLLLKLHVLLEIILNAVFTCEMVFNKMICYVYSAERDAELAERFQKLEEEKIQCAKNAYVNEIF